VTVPPHLGKETDLCGMRILHRLWDYTFPLPAAWKDSELQTTIFGYTQGHNLTNILYTKTT